MANTSPAGNAWHKFTMDRPKKHRGRLQRDPQSGNVTGLTNETWSYSRYTSRGVALAFIVGWLGHDFATQPINSQKDAGDIGVEGAQKIGDTADAGVHILGGMVGGVTSSAREFAGNYVHFGREDSSTPTTTIAGNVPPTTGQVIGGTLLQGVHRISSSAHVYDVNCPNAALGEVAGGSPQNALVGSFQPFDEDGDGQVGTGEGTWDVRTAVVNAGFVVDTGRAQGGLEIFSGVPMAVNVGQAACTFVKVS